MNTKLLNKKAIFNLRREWAGLLLSLFLGVVGVFGSELTLNLKNSWKYITGLVIFISSESIVMYFSFYSLKKEIMEIANEVSNVYKNNLDIIKTYSEIHSFCPESSITLYNELLPTVNDLLKDDHNYWWFLKREIDKFCTIIKGWPSIGCETNHSYIQALKEFSKRTTEVCMTSVIPPILWKRKDIGSEYFNSQVKLRKYKHLKVHRIFLIKQGYEADVKDKELIIKLHKENGFDISFVETNSYQEYIDFVIFSDIGVIKSEVISESFWQGLDEGRNVEEIWDAVKEATAKFYPIKHVESLKCIEMFEKYVDRYSE